MNSTLQFTIRPARTDDYEHVAAFTQDTWSDREVNDYIPDVYHDWIADDAKTKKTLVAAIDTEGDGERTSAVGSDIAGLGRTVMLSADEAWGHGMRVNPAYRDAGVSTELATALFEWVQQQGATVSRIMVFSWNSAGLGSARAAGFEPAIAFRWAYPDPGTDTTVGSETAPDLPAEPSTANVNVTTDPVTAWNYWTTCDACEHLNGLTLDQEESWAVSQLTGENLHDAAEETSVFAIGAEQARGMTYRTRITERQQESGTVRWAEYGVGAWDDLPAARSLFAAISADAERVSADRTRVLIPETPRYVSDAAWLRVDISDEPVFVLEADLSTRLGK